MNFAPPDGVHNILALAYQTRIKIIRVLQKLYESWGYKQVDVPVLEHYQVDHPAAKKSFKLSDRNNEVLALRADFTPAIANLVKLHYPKDQPLRFQYSGKLWQTIAPDMMRTREFTQVGVELVGISNARADAELIHLARESLREIGLVPRIEIGSPGFVKALFDVAEIPLQQQLDFARVIDNKDLSGLQEMLEPFNITAEVKNAITQLVDLYGDVTILEQAHKLALWPKVSEAVEHLMAVIEQFEDTSELLIDLGMARRLSYYTGLTFRAYTPNFGQPILGGGRYDGDLLPFAAGFALGLERVVKALPVNQTKNPAPLLLTDDDVAARALRAKGYIVIRALEGNVAAMHDYAKQKAIPYILTSQELIPIVANPPELEQLTALLKIKVKQDYLK